MNLLILTYFKSNSFLNTQNLTETLVNKITQITFYQRWFCLANVMQGADNLNIICIFFKLHDIFHLNIILLYIDITILSQCLDNSV